MNQQPKVSLIIPCYNHAQFLKESVVSALSSSYQNIEIIIVDDGSKDNSFEIAKELEKIYPTLVFAFSQPNSGPSVARNKAISKSSGKYILPLDADDKISNDYIKQAVDHLESDPEIKLVYCEAEKFGKKNGPWNLRPFSQASLALDNMIFVSALFRKSDWEETGGFDERLKWGWEDWEFWINLLKNGGKVKKLSCVGFFYRIHEVSRRKSVNKKIKKFTLALLNSKHAGFLEKQLGGPIRNPRSWSKPINRLSHFSTLLSATLQKEKFELNFVGKINSLIK